MIAANQEPQETHEEDMALCPACGSKVRRLHTTDPEVAPVGLCETGHMIPLREAAAVEPDVDMSDPKAFAEWARARRREAGLTQSALARLVGVNDQTISNMERAYVGISRKLRELIAIKLRDAAR